MSLSFLAKCTHVCVYVCMWIYIQQPVREERGKRYEVHGLKREVVISPGLVPETLVKLSCGLIIINRAVGRHDLRYKRFAGIRLSSYFSFRVFSIATSASLSNRWTSNLSRVHVIEFYIYIQESTGTELFVKHTIFPSHASCVSCNDTSYILFRFRGTKRFSKVPGK